MHVPRGPEHSVEEYLAHEARTGEKHELVDGVIVAMSGSSPEHSLLAQAVANALARALEGRPCGVFNSDLRIALCASGERLRPDVSVVCGSWETVDDTPPSLANPVLVVEVTSKSTERYDRGLKREKYATLSSLAGVLIVSHARRELAFHRRGEIEADVRGRGGRIAIPGLDVTLDVDAIYDAVERVAPPEIAARFE